MAGEFRHTPVGTELHQSEWEALAAHGMNLQAKGDLIIASSPTQLVRLGGTVEAMLQYNSDGDTEWETSPTISGTLTTNNLTVTGTSTGTGSTIVAGEGVKGTQDVDSTTLSSVISVFVTPTSATQRFCIMVSGIIQPSSTNSVGYTANISRAVWDSDNSVYVYTVVQSFGHTTSSDDDVTFTVFALDTPGLNATMSYDFRIAKVVAAGDDFDVEDSSLVVFSIE